VVQYGAGTFDAMTIVNMDVPRRRRRQHHGHIRDVGQPGQTSSAGDVIALIEPA